MKAVIEVFVVAGALLIGAVGAQEPPKPALQKGVSVQMAEANHAVEMRAADQQNATIVAITADGKVFAGITATEPAALGSLVAETVYVKADSRAPFQKVLAVLDALRGKSVVLLAAAPSKVAKAGAAPPYGITLSISR